MRRNNLSKNLSNIDKIKADKIEVKLQAKIASMGANAMIKESSQREQLRIIQNRAAQSMNDSYFRYQEKLSIWERLTNFIRGR